MRDKENEFLILKGREIELMRQIEFLEETLNSAKDLMYMTPKSALSIFKESLMARACEVQYKADKIKVDILKKLKPESFKDAK